MGGEKESWRERREREGERGTKRRINRQRSVYRRDVRVNWSPDRMTDGEIEAGQKADSDVGIWKAS